MGVQCGNVIIGDATLLRFSAKNLRWGTPLAVSVQQKKAPRCPDAGLSQGSVGQMRDRTVGVARVVHRQNIRQLGGMKAGLAEGIAFSARP